MNWKKIVGSLAPVAGQLIGGPLGAGVATKVADALGLGSGATDDEINKAIAVASPDTLAKIKKDLNDHVERLKELDVDLEEIAADDRDSARNRQIQLKDPTPALIAIVVIGLWIYVQYFFLNHTFPEQNEALVMRALGILDGILISVITYYYGSSRGSKQKTEMLSQK